MANKLMRGFILGILLVVIALLFTVVAGDVEGKTQEWDFTTDSNVASVSISSDGEYIGAGSFDNIVYLFHKDSSTPTWSYTTGVLVNSVAISADGEYIAAASNDNG